MIELLLNAVELAGIVYLIFLGHGLPFAISSVVTAAEADAHAVVTDISNVVDPLKTTAVPVVVTTTGTIPAA